MGFDSTTPTPRIVVIRAMRTDELGIHCERCGALGSVFGPNGIALYDLIDMCVEHQCPSDELERRRATA